MYFIKQHLKSKMPITPLEANILYGVQDLGDVIYRARKTMKIKREIVSMNDVVKRLNKVVKMTIPANIKSRNIKVSQFRV